MIPLAQITGPAGTPAPPALRPIVPPVPVPMPLWEILLIAGGALAAIALLVWLVITLARRRPPVIPLLPREIALRELRTLREQQPPLDPIPFSFAVSDILRTYIAAQFGLHARQQTSPEFLASIAGTPHFTSAEQQTLTRFLDQGDLIKFAHQGGTAEQTSALWSDAETFVKGSAHESI